MKTTDTHVYFYMGRDIYSNFWTDPQQFKDPFFLNHAFDCTEQAFMAYKARFFSDDQSLSLILKEPRPALAKELGRAVMGYDDKSWSCVRLGYMTYVNYLKFSQNERYKKQLLDTGDRTIVEASKKDKVWGVGLYEDDPLILEEKNWLGTNLLGVALMHVRNLLK